MVAGWLVQGPRWGTMAGRLRRVSARELGDGRLAVAEHALAHNLDEAGRLRGDAVPPQPARREWRALSHPACVGLGKQRARTGESARVWLSLGDDAAIARHSCRSRPEVMNCVHM